ncbi:MAG TPA: DedA family protein [Chitinophagales bacterium]|nr:DedA family protein [Chitinophagales bacterium]
MEYLKDLIDLFLHLDDHLHRIISEYGTTTYVILFVIIFVETGLVIMPLLPGDSLLFAAGTFAALGSLNIYSLIILLFIAAVLGDTVNYYFGKTIGLKVLHWKIGGRQMVRQEYLDKTHRFYEKYGAKTIVIARFVPIVRTFAPFVAGIGEMSYGKFISYNIIGGFVWVTGLTLMGYFFGNIPIVKRNFETVILAIIFISVLPMIVEFLKHRFRKKEIITKSEGVL